MHLDYSSVALRKVQIHTDMHWEVCCNGIRDELE